jgi:hypothetical protein
MVAFPAVGDASTHGGYCGAAVKPIALNMVAEIARDPVTKGLPISGIGGIGNWRDAAEFIALGAGSVQVCTAAIAAPSSGTPEGSVITPEITPPRDIAIETSTCWPSATDNGVPGLPGRFAPYAIGRYAGLAADTT